MLYALEKESDMRILLTALSMLLSAYGAIASETKIDQFTFIVGFAPGGTSTVAARQIGHAINQAEGINVIVESREGASGRLAANSVLSQNNSRVLYFMSSTSEFAVPPDIGIVPIALIATFDYVAVTSMNSPATLSSYLEAARTNEKLQSYTSSGTGTTAHLIGDKIFRTNGMPGVHVPYRGSRPAVESVFAGQVPMAIVPEADYRALQSGLHLVARSGDGIDATGWIAVYGPSSISREEVGQYAQIFKTAVENSKVQLKASGFDAHWGPAEELSALHNKSLQWKPELERLGIKF